MRSSVMLPITIMLFALCAGVGNAGHAYAAIAVNTLTVMDSAVQVTWAEGTFNRRTGEQGMKVTVKNTSADPIPGTVWLALHGITPASVTALYPEETSGNGTPFFKLGLTALTPGQSFTRTLTFANPSRARLTFLHSVYGTTGATGNNLPPDPGEAGKATLQGTDLDGDGVRDDVQRYIAENFPGDQRIQNALKGFAKAQLETLINAQNKNASIQHSVEASRTHQCLYFIFEEAGRAGDMLRAEVLNTEARSLAYITYNNNLGGQGYRLLNDDELRAICP